MVPNEKAIHDREMIDAIIRKALVCRLAFSDDGTPYVVPMNFGYRDGVLYFHGSPRGRKIDIIRRNPSVCFEIDIDHEIVSSDAPCRWSMKYRSVIGSGTASLVESTEEKREALAVIGEHYTRSSFEVPEENVRRAAVIRVVIDTVSGRCSGY